MKNFDLVKVKKMVHILRIVFQVFFWTCALAAVVSVLATLILFFVPEQNLVGWDYFRLSFSIDSAIVYKVDPQVALSMSVKPILRSIFLMSVVLFSGIAILFRQLIALLKTVELDQPFAKENSRRVTIMGIVFLIGSIVYPLTEVYVASTIIHAYNLSNLQVNLSVNSVLLLAGFMMVILGGIFQYGNFLQDEYDHTL